MSLGGFLRARCGERANATRRGSSWIRSFVVCVTDDDMFLTPAAQLCPGSLVYVVKTPTLSKMLSITLAVTQSLTSSPTTFRHCSVTPSKINNTAPGRTLFDLYASES